MPRRCTVCGHREREAIDRLLADRSSSYRGIARQFQLDDDAVRRHAGQYLLEQVAGHAETHRELPTSTSWVV